MHRTKSGEKIKELKISIDGLERELWHLGNLPLADELHIVRKQEISRLRSEISRLKTLARIEDVNVWQAKKVKKSRKGVKEYLYWYAGWQEGGRSRHFHLGPIAKMDRETAIMKARRLKSRSLGLEQPTRPIKEDKKRSIQKIQLGTLIEPMKADCIGRGIAED